MQYEINLDHASHTPVDERVLAEFIRLEREFPGNPTAAHNLGQKAAAELERITHGVAHILGAVPQEIIFTSGASESNNLAIKGITQAYKHIGRHILSTPLEHPSISGTLSHLQLQGYEIELLKIMPNGQVDLDYLRKVKRKDTVLVCISAIDSELGIVQPLEEIADILGDIFLHIDAAQAVGKIANHGENYATKSISAHKFYGLSGVGILVKRGDVVLEPQIHGGKSATVYRSGTPTLSLAGATLTALEIATVEIETRTKAVQKLNSYLREKLPHINSPEQSSPFILNTSTPGIRGVVMQDELAKHGINISVKSACSADSSPSRAVLAVTGNKKLAQCSWRISLSHHNTMDEMNQLLTAVGEVTSAKATIGYTIN